MLDARRIGQDWVAPAGLLIDCWFHLNSLCEEEWQGSLSDELEGMWNEGVLMSVDAVRPSLSRDYGNPCHNNQSPGRSSKPQMVSVELRSSARE